MTNTREQTQEEQRRSFQHEAQNPSNEKVQTQRETDRRHYEPIQTTLPNEATSYDWKRETGDIQSYQHSSSGSWLHIDSQGQFYDRHAQPIERDHALEHAAHVGLRNNEVSQSPAIGKDPVGTDQGLSL